jgi:hypothetical protein
MTVVRVASVVVGVAFAAACSAAPATRYPLAEVQQRDGVHEVLCAGGTYAQRIHLRGSVVNHNVETWGETDDGTRQMVIVWPAGYSAAFNPQLVVYDAAAHIVARDGDLVHSGCPMPNGELVDMGGGR